MNRLAKAVVDLNTARLDSTSLKLPCHQVIGKRQHPDVPRNRATNTSNLTIKVTGCKTHVVLHRHYQRRLSSATAQVSTLKVDVITRIWYICTLLKWSRVKDLLWLSSITLMMIFSCPTMTQPWSLRLKEVKSPQDTSHI